MECGQRASWEEYALKLAQTASMRSEDPYQKVGACALNKERMVLALGYNGLASGKNINKETFWQDRDRRRKYMIHAEANCLSLCEKGAVDLLAVTLLPCSYCATMIAAHGVKSVVYKEVYKRDLDAINIFEFYGIELINIKV